MRGVPLETRNHCSWYPLKLVSSPYIGDAAVGSLGGSMDLGLGDYWLGGWRGFCGGSVVIYNTMSYYNLYVLFLEVLLICSYNIIWIALCRMVICLCDWMLRAGRRGLWRGSLLSHLLWLQGPRTQPTNTTNWWQHLYGLCSHSCTYNCHLHTVVLCSINLHFGLTN